MFKKLFIFVLVSFVLVTIIIVLRNPIIGKFFSGTARLIGKETKSEIYIDGKKKSDAKLFLSRSNFEETEKRDYLILYLRDVKDYDGIPVLIIDKENQIVKFPNSNEKDYDVVFENLLQSDSGANVMVPLNNKLKGLGFEPNLKIENNVIKFKMLVENKICEIIINIA